MTRHDKIRERLAENTSYADMAVALEAVVEWLAQHPRTHSGELVVDGDIVLDIIAEQVGA